MLDSSFPLVSCLAQGRVTYVNATLPTRPTLSFPNCVYMSTLCVSTPSLQIPSSLPFFFRFVTYVFMMFVLNSRHNWALRFSPLPFLLDQAALFSRSHKIFSNTCKNRLSPLCFLSSVKHRLQFKNPEHVKNNTHKPLLWFL